MLRMAIEVEFLRKLSIVGMDVEVTDIAAVGESLKGAAADIALRRLCVVAGLQEEHRPHEHSHS